MGIVSEKAILKATYEETLDKPKPTGEKREVLNPGANLKYVNFVNDKNRDP